MLYVLHVIVEVNVVDDVMSVHVCLVLTRMNELLSHEDFWACEKLP